MKIDNRRIMLSMYKLYEEIKELEIEMAFIHLLNKRTIIKKANSIILLQRLINRNIQYGNYRSVIRYFVAIKILVDELKKYRGEVRERITHMLLES